MRALILEPFFEAAFKTTSEWVVGCFVGGEGGGGGLYRGEISVSRTPYINTHSCRVRRDGSTGIGIVEICIMSQLPREEVFFLL